jgi:hypothetical protein
MPRVSLPSIRLGITAMALMVLVACGGEKDPSKAPLEIDPNYSVNVIPVPAFWPREKFDWSKDEAQKVVQKDTLAKYGRPDYIRMLYTFEDRMVRPAEAMQGNTMPGKRPTPLVEWVWIDDNRVVRFDGAQAKEREISDELRMVCLNGDPGQVTRVPLPGAPDKQRVTYVYFNLGKEFIFVDGKKVDEKTLSHSADGLNLRF